MSDEQRAHPENFCERCGASNISWYVDSDRFNLAMGSSSPIVCVACFVNAHQAATGLRCSWELRPATPFRPIEPMRVSECRSLVEAADIVAAFAAAVEEYDDLIDVGNLDAAGKAWDNAVAALGLRAVSWQAEHGTEERT